MSSKRIITVTGATGAQGRSVVDYLLKDGTFAVRATTRNPDSPAAKELATQGVHVVQANARDPASLVPAFKGAYGVFGLTNYWEPGIGFEGEAIQGKNLVDAAKASGVEHFVWSSLEHTHLHAMHFEAKAFVDDYLKLSGVPRTSLFTAAYFENFTTMLALKKRPDGSYEFPFPFPADSPFMVFPASETGAYALAAFLDPATWLGRDMHICTTFMTLRDMLTTIATVSGKTVHVPEVPRAEWLALRGVVPEEFWLNMEVLYHFGAPPFRDPELARRLNPGMQTFREWVEQNVARLVP